MNYNENSCGALQSDSFFAPAETRELILYIRQKNNCEADAILNQYKSAGKVSPNSFKNFWHSKLENFIETPSDEFFNMDNNVWNAYLSVSNIYLVKSRFLYLLRTQKRLRLQGHCSGYFRVIVILL